MPSKLSKTQRDARKMVRNVSDELAIEKYGAEFSEYRANHVCDFIESQLVLYEGEHAGEPFHLQDWQRDYVRRAFGWIIFDEFRQRWLRRFKKCFLWCPKKNGKSPLGASVGLYLFLEDNEPGQKVFSCAKTGKQAKDTVHKHAIKMAEKAGFFKWKLIKLNKTTQTMSYAPLDAEYLVLSGAEIDAQEGINGSCILDETHTIDSRLARVIEHMGASRAEPMLWSNSTVGKNPDCWGKEQFDYGRHVIAGDVDDPEYLFQFYGVEETATDEECKDPETWVAANPSIDVTIHRRELATTAKRAQQQGLADWATWKMYRLNQWQNTASPWLSKSDFQQCTYETFDLAEFDGEPCGLGLDLSDTRDSTCLCLTFERDGYIYQWPFFWMAEDYATRHSHAYDFRAAATRGDLVLCPGGRIDQAYVQSKLEEINDRFRVQRISYDRYHAQNLANWWQSNLGWADEVQSFEFPQTIVFFAAPTSELETHIINGTYRHPANRFFSWQAGHCQVKTDVNRNKRPVKPKDHTKKVDGLVAGIMSLWSFNQGDIDPGGDYYEHNELEVG